MILSLNIVVFIFSMVNAKFGYDEYPCYSEVTTAFPPTYPAPTEAPYPTEGPTIDWETPAPGYGNIVLRGGAGPHEGNVYVTSENGAILPVASCEYSGGYNYFWTCSEAEVVCRQLGLTAARYYSIYSKFGKFESDFAWKNVTCNGNEEKLIDCSHELDDDYWPGKAAGVSCFEDRITTTYPPTETSTSNPADDCPEGWLDAVSGCIILTNITVSSWIEAGLVCEDMGGFLIEPKSEEQFNLVTSLLQMIPEYYGQNNWWIGLTDSGNEGNWLWQHSAEFTSSTFWGPSSPNDSDNNHDDCVMLRFDQDYMWQDAPCETSTVDSHPIGVICQH